MPFATLMLPMYCGYLQRETPILDVLCTKAAHKKKTRSTRRNATAHKMHPLETTDEHSWITSKQSAKLPVNAFPAMR